jgi:hypothetical protein
MAEITLDFFPATVRVGDRTWKQVRVIVADGTARLFALQAGRPEQVLAVRLTAPVTHAGFPYNLSTEGDNPDWAVQRASGCGCGHPLKRASQVALLAAQ